MNSLGSMSKRTEVLTSGQREEFLRDGVVVLRGHLNVQRDIVPLQLQISKVIGLVAEKNGFSLPREDRTPENFDAGFLDLVAACPDAAGQTYDAVKHLLGFKALAFNPRLASIFSQLRQTDLIGSSSVSNGIRIDRPQLTNRLVPWHQDFTFQLRSLDGIVFWIPLMPITKECGPVQFYVGSHGVGALPLEDTAGNDSAIRNGYYETVRIADESKLDQTFAAIAPETLPGDVVAFDFLSIHRSGYNISNRTRWSAQIRYFNFEEEFGRSIAWTGSFKSNRTVREINEQLTKLNAGAFGRARAVD
jgi:hypothetical protein